MKNVSTKEIVSVIKEKGIPIQWQEFGMKLSMDGALSTEITNKIITYRKNKNHSEALIKEITKLFQAKIENLVMAQQLLQNTIAEYDKQSIWSELDDQMFTVNFDEVIDFLRSDFALHPYPVVLESLRFNWKYMKENGVRQFYIMTQEYLEKVKSITKEAKSAFGDEVMTKLSKPYWLLRSDLISIEVPMHCDTCRITISVIIAAREITQVGFFKKASREAMTVKV